MAFLMKLNYPRGVEFLQTVCEVPVMAEGSMPKIARNKLFGNLTKVIQSPEQREEFRKLFDQIKTEEKFQSPRDFSFGDRDVSREPSLEKLPSVKLRSPADKDFVFQNQTEERKKTFVPPKAAP